MIHFNYSLEGLSRPVGLRAFMRRGLSQPSTSASTAFSTVKARRAATSKTSAISDTAASEKLELDAGDAGVPTDTVSRPRVSMVSLGCPKNTVDGEVLLGDLFKSGFDIVDDHEDSDAIIVNTCAFVEEAKEQSLEAVMEAAALKQARPGQKVVITGCMAQRYSTELAEQLPEVDAVVGFERYGHLPKTLKTQLGVSVTEKDELAAEESSGSSSTVSRVQVGEATVPFRPELNRHRLTPKHTAYLRVAEGCDHSCSFCAIPGFRGRFRSKPWGAVLQEARVLVDSGVKELNLIAEDTNQYGMDRRDGMGLAQLMRELSQLEGLKWMRILYAYPSYFSDELVEEIASNPKVCKYIDMPLQHISNLTLLAMNRPSQQHTIKLLHKLRSRIPDLALRTTFISGFPGETPEQHKELVKFCADFRFERMGAFAYSQEEGTPAFHYPDMVAEEVRQYRRDELVSQQQRIGERFARTLVGREVDVLVDGCTEDGELYGRTQWDAPDIDPIVFLSQPADSSLPALEIGQIRRCRINSHVTFDLEAHPVA